VSFHNILFPDDHNYNTAGGPGHNTKIVVLDSGKEQRIPRWNGARRQYEINYDDREHPKLVTLQEFIVARQGSTHSFRLRDWHDCNSSVDGGLAPELGGTAPDDEDVLLGTGDNVEVDFQMVKFYADVAATRTRNITKPRNGTVVVALDGAVQTEGTHYSVNYQSGIVTFNTAPGIGEQITAGFEFDTPVRFTREADELLETPIKDFGSGDAVNVRMIEDLEDYHWPEERYLGGSDSKVMTANILLSLLDATVQVLDVQSAGLVVRLPDMSSAPGGGGPWFYLINDGLNQVAIHDFANSLQFNLAAGETATVVYEAGNGNWWAGVC
jgi:uncharacterized protein (TIGR02217 family)